MTSKKLTPIKSLLQTLGLFALIFIVVWGFVNAPAILTKIDYWLDHQFGKGAEESINITEMGEIKNKSQRSNLKNDHLYIPKINVDARVSWNVPQSEEQEKLRESVIQLKGTALPGKPGNIFITGHSSYYWWIGQYTRIFTLLNKMEKGDKIVIVYKNKIYTYRVYDKFTVKSHQTYVLDQGKSKELSLMTCVPIGTNWNRLVVKAKQINVSNK
jgi:LPXTG-site transpeptidase (sortase) family protein